MNTEELKLKWLEMASTITETEVTENGEVSLTFSSNAEVIEVKIKPGTSAAELETLLPVCINNGLKKIAKKVQEAAMNFKAQQGL